MFLRMMCVALAVASCGGIAVIDPGDDAGAGGAPGATGPIPRRVEVVGPNGAPEAGVYVVGHDASGAVLEVEETAADGTATVTVASDGMITIAYTIRVALPDTSLDLLHHLIETLVGLGDREDIGVRIQRPREHEAGPSMTVSVSKGGIGGSSGLYQVHVSCTVGVTNAYLSPDVTTSASGCEGESTFDLTVYHLSDDGSFTVLEYGSKTGIPLEPGTKLALTLGGDVVMSPPPFANTFTVAAGHALTGVSVEGFDDEGLLRARGLGAVGADQAVTVPSLPDGGVAAWRVIERLAAAGRERHRRLTSLPQASSWEVTPLAVPTAPSLDFDGPEPPSLSWTLSNGEPAGDGVVVDWQSVWGNGSSSGWRLWLPPGATDARFPQLPDEVAALAPTTTAELGVKVDVKVIDAGAGDRFDVIADSADYSLTKSPPVVP